MKRLLEKSIIVREVSLSLRSELYPQVKTLKSGKSRGRKSRSHMSEDWRGDFHDPNACAENPDTAMTLGIINDPINHRGYVSRSTYSNFGFSGCTGWYRGVMP